MEVAENGGSSSDEPQLSVYCNTTDEVLFANIEASTARGYPSVMRGEPDGVPAIICGSGPSITDEIDVIRQLHKDGGTIFALNGAAQFLCERGIMPEYLVMLDAREHNTQFIQNTVAWEYLLASQCAPCVFDQADRQNANVKLFHPCIENIEDHLLPGMEDVPLIGGGITVGLTAMALAFAMGYREEHLFGYDSSYADDTLYVSPQVMSHGELECLEATCAGRTFKTSRIMAKQAMEFPAFSMMLAENDCVIHVHGSGLLPTMAFQMMKPLPEPTAESETAKYERMWAEPEYRKVSPGEKWLDVAIKILGMKVPESVIDFGCGTGRAAQRLQDMGFGVLGIDFAKNCLDRDVGVPFFCANLWQLPKLSADYGICCDVMEHIPPEHVDGALVCISRSATKVFFSIAFDHDVCGTLIGEPLHLTVRPAAWWTEKLQHYWKHVRRIGANGFVVQQKET